jgi:hypothetical protein
LNQRIATKLIRIFLFFFLVRFKAGRLRDSLGTTQIVTKEVSTRKKKTDGYREIGTPDKHARVSDSTMKIVDLNRPLRLRVQKVVPLIRP